MNYKDKYRNYKKVVGDMYVVNEDIHNKRMSICKSCSKYSESTDTCNECKCTSIFNKTALNYSKCPLGKWNF